MFSRKRIAAISALLGGLAVTCAGANQAYAAGSPSDCTRTAPGSIVCVHKSQTVHTTKDGKHIVKETQHCDSTSRNIMVLPRIGLLSQGTQHTRVGSVVNCSPKAPPQKELKESKETQLSPVGALLRPLVDRL
ncbi:hypothetical protein ACWD6P_03445 [Streptomyces sp. NPDC002446]